MASYAEDAGKYFRHARLLPECHNRDAAGLAAIIGPFGKTVMEIGKIGCEAGGIALAMRVRSDIQVSLMR
ncbi:hypothetical protein [Bradyrhizobium sp. Ai1a-2]|uniref:hypothetical protein n=1 Tax=Bradyrhizobium sp. Ai1a-2 TaxID=196490 RepID=UPI000484FD6E|nr:hypothetical protein [Bradyrhizobium sp. Ai1a-2]